MNTTTVIDTALELIDRGFSVIPVKPKGKEPLVQWKEYQTRIATEEEIYKWAEMFPDMNLGVVTGKISNIVVVDCDGEEGIEWMRNNLPVTSVYVKTAKGYHAYYKWTKHTKNKTKLAPQVDLRADGGFVVVPPSVHATGFVYTWEFTPGLNGWADLTEFPEIVVTQDNNLIDLTTVKKHLHVHGEYEGTRNDTAARLAGAYFARGLQYEEVLTLLKGWNLENNPPLPLKELETVCNSIHQKHQASLANEGVEVGEKSITVDKIALHPQGFLKDFVEYVEQTSFRSFRLWGIAAGVSLLGTLASFVYDTPLGNVPSLYIVLSGHTSAGKSEPLKRLLEVLINSNKSRLLGATEFTSDVSLYRHLESNRITLSVVDEIGDVFAQMKSANGVKSTIPRALKNLYSMQKVGLIKHYADTNLNINLPFFSYSLIGATTPNRIWQGLDTDDAVDGLIPRMLIVESRHDLEPKKTPTRKDNTQLLQWINDFPNPSYNPSSTTNLIPSTKRLTFSKEAEKKFWEMNDIYDYYTNKYTKKFEPWGAVFGKAGEQLDKLATIHAISRKSMVVDVCDIDWAEAFLRYCILSTTKALAESIYTSPFDQDIKTYIKIIRANTDEKKRGLTERELFRLYRPRTTNKIEDILNIMVKQGLLVKIQTNRTFIYAIPSTDTDTAIVQHTSVNNCQQVSKHFDTYLSLFIND